MGRPNRKWQLLGVAGILGLIVAVCLLTGPGWQDSPKKTTPKGESAGNGPQTSQPPQGSQANLPVELKDGIGRLGDPAAKVSIEVYFPGHGSCGNETADFAHRVYLANKGKVQVLFVDFDSPKGAEYQGKAGLHCSGLAINGKQQFEAHGAGGKKQTVDMSSNFGDRWGDKEFLSALDVVFEQKYGKPANHKLPPSEITGPGHGSIKSGAPPEATKAAKNGGGA